MRRLSGVYLARRLWRATASRLIPTKSGLYHWATLDHPIARLRGRYFRARLGWGNWQSGNCPLG